MVNDRYGPTTDDRGGQGANHAEGMAEGPPKAAIKVAEFGRSDIRLDLLSRSRTFITVMNEPRWNRVRVAHVTMR
jgi:hypothetical protein